MGRKLGRKIIIFVVAVTAIQVFTFQHYNTLLGGSSSSGGVIAIPSGQTSTTSATSVAKQVSALKQRYKFVTVSGNNQFVAYLDSQNVLHVVQLSNGATLSTAANAFPVQYVGWIRNDSLFVGEQAAPGKLVLKTVESNTGVQRVVQTFAGLDASASFKTIAYSALTNDVYILIGTSSTSVVYHFNTNSDLSVVDLGGRFIKNIALTQTGNILYFEDHAAGSFNVLYRQNGSVNLISLNAALIAVVNRTLYYGTVNQNGLVTAVYKEDNLSGTKTLVQTLTQPALAASIRVDNNGAISIGSNT